MAAMNGKGPQVIFLFSALMVVTIIITVTWWPLHQRSTFTLERRTDLPACEEAKTAAAIDPAVNECLRNGLSLLSEQLTKLSRYTTDGRSQNILKQAFTEVDDMLNILGHSGSSSASVLSETTVEDNQIRNPDVCQEEYSASNPRAFIEQNCTYAPKFHTILTLVFNFVHYNKEDVVRASDVMSSANKLYPNMRIIAAIPDHLKLDSNSFQHTSLYSYSKTQSVAEIWKKLISKVKTKYVYIGRNVAHFTKYDRLERLVREINNLEAYAVGSAVRGYHSGHWSHGCEQSMLRNFTLVYTAGYHRSIEECLICHHIHGPFVAKAKAFQQVTLSNDDSDNGLFASWFLEIKNRSSMAVVCPDSMSFVSDKSRETTTKSQWLNLAKAYQVEKIRLSNSDLIEFDCDEAETYCSKYRYKAGLALSNCCMKELSTMIKFAVEKCKDSGLLCQTTAGTTLGAVKFSGILPWELDADLVVHRHNVTSYKDMVLSAAKKHGYKTRSDSESHMIETGNWKVEAFFGDIDNVELTEQGLTPTYLNIDGKFMIAANSPGLEARNAYGLEIYRHSNHWVQVGRMSSNNDVYKGGEFIKCPQPGKHYCLDNTIADGSIMFREPVP